MKVLKRKISKLRHAARTYAERSLQTSPHMALRGARVVLFLLACATWFENLAARWESYLTTRRLSRAGSIDVSKANKTLELAERQIRHYERRGDRAKALEWVKILEGFGHGFLANRRMDLGEQFFASAANHMNINSPRGMLNLRHLGITQFMRCYVGRAKTTFEQEGLAHRFLRQGSRASPPFRVLGRSWFAAIGHVAMIDFLIKKRELGWYGDARRFVVEHNVAGVPGNVILGYFGEHGVDQAWPEPLESYYEAFRQESDPEWPALTLEEREGMVDEYWQHSFPDGDVKFYAHACAKIQNEWEARQLPPLLHLKPAQVAALDTILRQLGVPTDAWYVCLHVRETGFHQSWNKVYPSSRDARIKDYHLAIQAIVDRGGWVIRMGDASMTPLAPMPGVVDYVHTKCKSEQADMLLSAGCRFMLGTNSGYSILPASYGVPCVLTNWVPIALPNWYGIDLMIPKLMRSKATGKTLTFDAMFDDPLGAIQFVADYPPDIEIVENTSEEICAVTLEMFGRLNGETYSAGDEDLQSRYFDLALKKGSYRGSRIGREFLKNYEALLP